MIEATVHNKLPRELQNREDCLTSTVWGLLKYPAMRPVLAHFLRRAVQYFDDSNTLGETISESCLLGGSLKVKFWERDAQFGEPDILIEGKHLAFVVEDKLNAPLSQNPARALDDDSHVEDVPNAPMSKNQLQKYVGFLNKKYKGHDKYVIYLTGDWIKPTDVRGPDKQLETCLYWLSWSELHSVAFKSKGGLTNDGKAMAEDLIRYLKHLGFYYFHGFQKLKLSKIPSPLFWKEKS